MKTTRQRLLNIITTMSVVVNLALLAGIGYLVSVDHHVNQVCSNMNSPVMVYVNKTMDLSNVEPAVKSPAKP